jgi:hypothetical protein
LKEAKGNNKPATDLRYLNRNISELSLDIKTNRGKKMIEGRVAKNIVEKTGELEQEIIAPLNPILEKIEKSVKAIYKGENNPENMIATVQWCIDKNLIQEGFTLLQEGLISLFLPEDYCNEQKRNFVSGYLNCKGKDIEFDQTKGNNLSDNERSYIQEELKKNTNCEVYAEIFSQLTEFRNDINHAGIRENQKKANNFKARLKTLLDKYNQINQSSDKC